MVGGSTGSNHRRYLQKPTTADLAQIAGHLEIFQFLTGHIFLQVRAALPVHQMKHARTASNILQHAATCFVQHPTKWVASSDPGPHPAQRQGGFSCAEGRFPALHPGLMPLELRGYVRR